MAAKPPGYDAMRAYRAKRDSTRTRVLDAYAILGFLSSGTYGRVYKARVRTTDKEGKQTEEGEVVAIKKFKPDKEGEVPTYTGISQSACREIMLNRELHHENLAALHRVMLDDKSIYMIFEYAEHDFLQIIHYHSQSRSNIPTPTLKSLLWQLINGVAYLHDNWVLHRDLKPANILVNSSGVVKIGDLGLARIYSNPLQPLFASDKVVVTIWYRSPDLLLGARHYTASVDLWSVGCIFGELISLRPMFKGEEAKPDNNASKKQANGGVPFQKDQLTKVFEILGKPKRDKWPGLDLLPEVKHLSSFQEYNTALLEWYKVRMTGKGDPQQGWDLLSQLLIYNPAKRITAHQALKHPWWSEEPAMDRSAFPTYYPTRRLTQDDSDPKLSSAAVGDSARNASSRPASTAALPQLGRATKRARLD